jgi:hypothetical protein
VLKFPENEYPVSYDRLDLTDNKRMLVELVIYFGCAVIDTV